MMWMSGRWDAGRDWGVVIWMDSGLPFLGVRRWCILDLDSGEFGPVRKRSKNRQKGHELENMVQFRRKGWYEKD